MPVQALPFNITCSEICIYLNILLNDYANIVYLIVLEKLDVRGK